MTLGSDADRAGEAHLNDNKDVVRGYFRSVASADGRALDWLSDDVTWWVPQGSSLGGTYRGKPAVIEIRTDYY